MDKENNRGAAGLRRSAIAERIRLREEWSALKEVDGQTTSQQNIRKRCTPSSRRNHNTAANSKKKDMKPSQSSIDALRGVVALVEVGSEAKALPLRAALTALGASVLTTWSPLVTHLVWTDSGCRATRAKARALACKLVSPLWVEACAASNTKLSERSFPAAARQSDLPSPRTLRQLLKKAERENVPLIDLLNNSKESDKDARPRLRISTETDTSTDRDTSREDAVRVNTAPRRAMPPPCRQPPKSRRKLFTHKEADEMTSTDDETDAHTQLKKLEQNKLTQREHRQLARAERMARKLLAACDKQQHINNNVDSMKLRIVLTGMSRIERQAVTNAIHKLNGFIQKSVNKRTTHVLLGSCNSNPTNITGITTHLTTPFSTNITNSLHKAANITNSLHKATNITTVTSDVNKNARTLNALLGCARGCKVLHSRWALDSAEKGKWLHHNGYEVQHLRKICQKARVERTALGRLNSEYAYDVFNGMRVYVTPNADQRDAAIQLLNLCGAIVQDGVQYGGILHGGATQNGVATQNGGVGQNGGQNRRIAHEMLTQCSSQYRAGVDRVFNRNGQSVDVIVGNSVGQVHSKWVFDSVAAARMRTTRRYINMNSFNSLEDNFVR